MPKCDEKSNPKSIREAIFDLNCKDRWTQADHKEMDRLYALLRAS